MTEQEREWNDAEWLRGAEWHLVAFRKPRLNWDHEHCKFCFQKIAEVSLGDPKAIQVAYRWSEHPHENANREEWLCPNCFREYQKEYGWSEVVKP